MHSYHPDSLDRLTSVNIILASNDNSVGLSALHVKRVQARFSLSPGLSVLDIEVLFKFLRGFIGDRFELPADTRLTGLLELPGCDRYGTILGLET